MHSWTVLIVSLLLKIKSSHGNCASYSFNVKDALKDSALTSRVFSTQHIQGYDSDCFHMCTLDCRCLSFNVCGKQCELNADKKDIMKNKIKVKPGCKYYDLRISQSSDSPTCCLDSNPCLHGGSCVAPKSNSKARFNCLCDVGFFGDRCQITKPPKSCADFFVEPLKPLSGEYEIVDSTDEPYPVYCDFDSEDNFVWTLLLSYTQAYYKGVGDKGLVEDLPGVNENSPGWEAYRLSRARMVSLHQHSSHWRATCSYDVFGVDFEDYVRVNMSDVDLITKYYFTGYNGPTACKTIEFMKVLGAAECRQCNFALYHLPKNTPMLQISNSKSWSHCTFDISQYSYICDPSTRLVSTYFAIESSKCIDRKFRCTAFDSSTTQNWLGKQI